MPRPFNVTVIQPPDYPHSAALYEAAEYVQDLIGRSGIPAMLSGNRIMPDHHNVIFGAHLLSAAHAAALPAGTILFNSEQLGNSEGWYFRSGVYRQLLARFDVWDYSLNNLRHIPHQRKHAIPFLFSPALIRDTPPGPSPGLLFYGAATPRRIAILDELRAAGVPVTAISDLYGPQRDAIMRCAWAVLNLHNADTVENFEAIRCFHPLINGIPVISEDSTDDPSADLYRDFLFRFRRETLLPGILGFMQDPAGFGEAVRARLEAFRQTRPLEHFGPVLEATLAGHG